MSDLAVKSTLAVGILSIANATGSSTGSDFETGFCLVEKRNMSLFKELICFVKLEELGERFFAQHVSILVGILDCLYMLL